MKERLRELYIQEIETSRLDFDSDPEYQKYYTQAEALWEEGEMPNAVFRLLDASDFVAFVHGFRLGAELAGWVCRGIPPASLRSATPL